MRIRLRLPKIKPEEYIMPEICPQAGCEGSYFKAHQQHVAKGVQDPDHEQVRAKRYKCMRCGRSFRVYPSGVSRAQRSDRLKGIGVMLYVLGISYGGVEDALAALGWAGSKSSVYRDVQAAGEGVKRLRQMQGHRRVQVAGSDTTFVTCDKEQVTIAVGVDAFVGDVLEIELVDAESVEAMRPFINDREYIKECVFVPLVKSTRELKGDKNEHKRQSNKARNPRGAHADAGRSPARNGGGRDAGRLLWQRRYPGAVVRANARDDDAG